MEISNKGISKIARMAGAPEDRAAGLYLRAKKGDVVKKGQVLFTIYSENKDKLESSIKALQENKLYVIGRTPKSYFNQFNFLKKS